MGGKGIAILADATPLDIKAGETEHLLLEYGEVCFRQLVHKDLLRKAGIARILVAVLDIGHAPVKLLTTDIQHLTEVQRIQMVLGFIHDDHDVIGRLVEYQQATATVVDAATRRILNLLEEGIGVSTLLVVVTGNL